MLKLVALIQGACDMGNHLSCIHTMSPSNRSPAAIRVLHAEDGRISEFDQPMKVAELMFEFANQFVVEYSSLQYGKRVNPLSADEEIRLSHVYILLPMQKLNRRLTAEEVDFLATILSKSPKAKAHRHAQRKVAPLRSDLSAEEDRQADLDRETSSSVPRSDSPELCNMLKNNGAQRQMSRTKSWVPRLETINESSLLKA